METEYTKTYRLTLLKNKDVNLNYTTNISFAVDVEDAYAEEEVETTHLLELYTDYDVINLFCEGNGYNWEADNKVNTYLNNWLNRKTQRFLRTNLRFIEARIHKGTITRLNIPTIIWIYPEKGYTWERYALAQEKKKREDALNK